MGVLRTNRGEGQDRLLTPSRVWAPPSPDPLHQVRLTQSPTKPARGIPSGHAVSPCSEGTPPARRSGARARKAMPVTSGCNQCLQNWPRSCPATGQRGCFPRDAEPVPPRQGFAHPEQQLHPGAALPRRGVQSRREPQQCSGTASPGISPWGLSTAPEPSRGCGSSFPALPPRPAPLLIIRIMW